MGIAKSLDSAISNVWPSVKSIAKIIINGLRFRPDNIEADGTLVILGNGPSLRKQLDDSAQFYKICAATTLCVNFAANAPEFFSIRPRYYVLADPHFFWELLSGDFRNENIRLLVENLQKVSWKMELFVALSRKKAAAVVNALGNDLINVISFPAVGVDGWDWLRQAAMKTGRAMPRPRNVLIPSIMIGIWLGYKQIYLLGADHSWLSTLSVDEDNRVISVQPHFYKDCSQELLRQTAVYAGVSLPQLLQSFNVAFSAYHQIQIFAEKVGVDIVNSTPGSFIDAFRRANLPQS